MKTNIELEKEVYKVFFQFIQNKSWKKEACGILIGTHSSDDTVLTIKKATKPQNKDIRTRYSYKIKSKYHQQELDKAFNNSNCQEVYLGTWHSHPEDNPTPSDVDKKDWKILYKKNKKQFTKMIFIIVGRKKIKWWIIIKGNLKFGGEI